MLLPRTSLLVLLAAGALFASGCGSSDNSAVTWVNTETEQSQTDAQTSTVPITTVPTTTATTPATTVPATTTPSTTPTTTTPGAAGGATIPADGGASSGPNGGTTVPNDTSGASTTTSTPKQDPDCKPGTGPGFPDSPQCEPASGPDARPDESG